MVDMKKVLVGLLFLIIFIILIFQIVGNSSSELISAADSVTDANNCSSGKDANTGTPLTYNFTSKQCVNSTGNDIYLAKQIDLPLNTLFGRSSVLLLIFMAVIFIIAITTVIKGIKSKGQ